MDDPEEEGDLKIDPFKRTPPPFVLDISREAVKQMKQKEMEERESLDLLPDCPPQILRKTPSRVLLKTRATKQRAKFTNLQTSSTPDLRPKSKRDSIDDPFYLEAVLNAFPKPPVHTPGRYTSRAPVNPGLRRQNSNFSLPTPRAYPGRVSKNWLDRPVQGNIYQSRRPPSFIDRFGDGRPEGW